MANSTGGRETYTTSFFKGDLEKGVYLPDVHTDNLMTAFLHLASEFWIMRRRMLVMEKLLAEKNVVSAARIDSYDPPTEDKAAWEAMRDKFIRQTFDVFTRRTAELPSKVPNNRVPGLTVSGGK
jgi:hypothetical protein